VLALSGLALFLMVDITLPVLVHAHCATTTTTTTTAAAAAAAARTAQDKRRAGEAFVYTVEFKTAGPMGISFNLANVSCTLFVYCKLVLCAHACLLSGMWPSNAALPQSAHSAVLFSTLSNAAHAAVQSTS
jgi:hypothetical protein